MQQFVVPQFIDVEDKIIGPITVRQFIILLVSGGLVFLAYRYSDFALFLVELLAIAVFTILFAFIKINGRPVHYFMLNFIQTIRRPFLRIWDKELSKNEIKLKMKQRDEKPVVEIRKKPKVASSRLAELSLIVDTGGIYGGEE